MQEFRSLDSPIHFGKTIFPRWREDRTEGLRRALGGPDRRKMQHKVIVVMDPAKGLEQSGRTP